MQVSTLHKELNQDIKKQGFVNQNYLIGNNAILVAYDRRKLSFSKVVELVYCSSNNTVETRRT
jgi:hypothetical protein